MKDLDVAGGAGRLGFLFMTVSLRGRKLGRMDWGRLALASLQGVASLGTKALLSIVKHPCTASGGISASADTPRMGSGKQKQSGHAPLAHLHAGGAKDGVVLLWPCHDCQDLRPL